MEFIQNLNINANWIDLVVFLVVVRCLFVGAKNGLTAELFRFIGIVLSLIFGVYWYSHVADVLIINFNLPAWLSQFVCFAIIVQLIRIIFKYGIALVLKMLNIQFVPQLERVGGGVLGFGRGVLTAAIVLLAASFIPSHYISECIYEKSFSGTFLIMAAERTYKSLTFWMPENETSKIIFSLPAAATRVKRV